MTRLEKKLDQYIDDFNAMCNWLNEFRSALIEAYLEGSDLRIINRQFKERMVRSGRRNPYFKRTRMSEYQELAWG